MSGELIGVIVGGFLTFISVVTAQVLGHQYTRQREREKLIREKAEMVLMALYRHRDYLAGNSYGSDNKGDVVDPGREVWALCWLYFPNCSGDLTRWSSATAAVRKFVAEDRLKRVSDVKAWIASEGVAWGQEMKRLFDAYVDALMALHVAVRLDVDKQISLEQPRFNRVMNRVRQGLKLGRS